jgi:hypothetical protein
MIREIKNKSSKFDGIVYVQAETHTDYPDPEITKEHSRQITQRMTPGELDRRLSGADDAVDTMVAALRYAVQSSKSSFGRFRQIIGRGIRKDPTSIDKVVDVCETPGEAIVSETAEGKLVRISFPAQSPEEWKGLVWGGLNRRVPLTVQKNLLKNMKSGIVVHPCSVGTYDDFNFANKLTIRLGRVSETEWVWQILAQDERFRATADNEIDVETEFVKSRVRPEIDKDFIFLRGTLKGKDNDIQHFTADAERMHEIFSQLHDWSLNWPGFAE